MAQRASRAASAFWRSMSLAAAADAMVYGVLHMFTGANNSSLGKENRQPCRTVVPIFVCAVVICFTATRVVLESDRYACTLCTGHFMLVLHMRLLSCCLGLFHVADYKQHLRIIVAWHSLEAWHAAVGRAGNDSTAGSIIGSSSTAGSIMAPTAAACAAAMS